MSDLNLEEYEILNYIYDEGYIAKKGDKYGALSCDKSSIILDFEYRTYDDVFDILCGESISLPRELKKLKSVSYLNIKDKIRYRYMLEDGESPDSIIKKAKKLSKARSRGMKRLEENYTYLIYAKEFSEDEIEEAIWNALTEEEINELLKKVEESNSFYKYKYSICNKITDLSRLNENEISDLRNQVFEAKSTEEIDAIYLKAKELDDSRKDDYTKYSELLLKLKENIPTSQSEEELLKKLKEKRFGYTDDLYKFLFDALTHNNLYYAISIANNCGCSIEEISKTAIKILENYEDLAKVENLEHISLRPLVKATYNPAFIKELQATLEMYFNNIREDYLKYEYEGINDPIAKAKAKLFSSCFFGDYSIFCQDFDSLVWNTHQLRQEESSKKSNTNKLKFYTYSWENIGDEIEKIKSLIFNDWYGEEIFGKPTAEEIVLTACDIAAPSLHKYVLRNYKDILQSSWHDATSTEWNVLKEESQQIEAYSLDVNLVKLYLATQGLALSKDGELIKLIGKNPAKRNISFPKATDVTEKPWWTAIYKNGVVLLSGLVFDVWPDSFYTKEGPTILEIVKQVKKTGHPGIMKFVLKKYKDELQETTTVLGYRSLYGILCETIEKVEKNPEDYEHLTKLYDAILSDNNIDIEARAEELEPHFSKQYKYL